MRRIFTTAVAVAMMGGAALSAPAVAADQGRPTAPAASPAAPGVSIPSEPLQVSTDPAIAANGFVALEDTKKLYGSQNIFPLVRADRADEVKETLNAVSAKLTTAAIADMLKQTDIDKKDPKTVAAEFLASNGLG